MREEKEEISKENFYVTTAIKGRLTQSGSGVGEVFGVSRETAETPRGALRTVEPLIVPRVLNKLLGISAKIKKHEKEMQRI